MKLKLIYTICFLPFQFCFSQENLTPDFFLSQSIPTDTTLEKREDKFKLSCNFGPQIINNRFFVAFGSSIFNGKFILGLDIFYGQYRMDNGLIVIDGPISQSRLTGGHLKFAKLYTILKGVSIGPCLTPEIEQLSFKEYHTGFEKLSVKNSKVALGLGGILVFKLAGKLKVSVFNGMSVNRLMVYTKDLQSGKEFRNDYFYPSPKLFLQLSYEFL